MVRTNKGFTLVELMVVIVIIGILAALAIPKFTDASTKAKISEIPTVIGSWDHGVLARITEVGGSPLASDEIVFENPTAESQWFDYTETYPGARDGSSSMEATVKAGKSIGDMTDADAGPMSTITNTAVITHTLQDFPTKYLGSFVPGS